MEAEEFVHLHLEFASVRIFKRWIMCAIEDVEMKCQ
jgi:hypothetical protein